MSYTNFAPFVESARPFSAIWRLILGVVTILILTVLWAFAVVFLSGLFIGASDISVVQEMLATDAPDPRGTLISLFLIVGSGLACMGAAALWHKRRVRTLFGPASKTLRHFALVTGISITTLSLVAVLSIPFLGWPQPNLDSDVWLFWLPLALLMILAQTGAEELVFRGYLQTQLAARFKSPVVWMIVPSILFAALHYAPEYSTSFTLAMLTGTFVFALVAADLTARTGSIGAAWGFHFANNILAVLIVSWQNAFSGLSLFKSARPLDTLQGFSPVFALDILTMIIVWAAIRKALAN